jgi:hypothetical protein
MDESENDMGMGGEAPPAAPESPSAQGGDKNTVVLSADHFPAGMTPKDGDKLTFCVTGPVDSEGNVSGYFESGGESGSGMNDWENDFRKSMSPQSKQEAPE